MSAIVQRPRTLREVIFFVISVAVFAVLNLFPGLTGSYADAAYGGGGGGSACPGDRCTGQNQPVCCTFTYQKCDLDGKNCKSTTDSYYFP